jgi:phage terminase large subunit-like protein
MTDCELPDGTEIGIGVDGARTRDTTVVAWAWRRRRRGRCRCHVWACRPEKPHHTFVPGRLNNDDARDFIRDVAARAVQIKALAYDPRYFDDQADELSDDDDVTDDRADAVRQSDAGRVGRLLRADLRGATPGITHDGDPVLRAHVRNAAGRRDPRAGGRSRRSTSVRSTRSPPS